MPACERSTRVPLAGKTVILLHPPTFRRFFNGNKKEVSSK